MNFPFTATDLCFWTYDSPLTRQHIAMFAHLDATPVRERLISKLDEACQLHARMRCRINPSGPRPVWTEVAGFSAADNFQWVPAEFSSNEQALSLAEKYFNGGLDHSRPPWLMVVLVNTLNAPAAPPAALFFMVHHAFADGIAGLSLFYSLCDNAREPAAGAPAAAKTIHLKAAEIRSGSLLSRSRALLSEAAAPKVASPLNGKNSAARRLSVMWLPLKQATALRRLLRVSLNDFLLLVLAKALADFDRRAGTSPTDLYALVPVNLREDRALSELGNTLSAIRVRLPIASSDTGEQLTQLMDELLRLKSSGSAGAYAMLSRLLAKLPGSIRRRCLSHAARRVNFICTNVPAPRTPKFLAGAQVLSVLGIPALMEGQGIAFAFVRSRTEVAVSAVVDPAIVADGQVLLSCFKAAFDQLIEEEPPQETAREAERALL